MALQLALAAENGAAPIVETSVDYLPGGVQTLRLVLMGDYTGQVRVRPRRTAVDPNATYAHEDGVATPHFLISWGGGHERYVALDFPARRLVHLLLWHVGDDNADHTATIDARDENDLLLASFQITLTYPRFGVERWAEGTLSRGRWHEVVPGLDGAADYRWSGAAVPFYQPRWWPARELTFSLDRPPETYLRLRRRAAGSHGDARLFVRDRDGRERLLAVIEGQIDPVLYDTRHITAQLFRFGRHYWVVRLWFFWLKLAYSREDLACCWSRDAGEVDATWRAVMPAAEGGLATAAWADRHEVPDAERIDILFDDDATPLFVATDLHWREMWGQVSSRPPIEAEIMNTRAQALAGNWQQLRQVLSGWSAIILSRLARNRPPYQPHLEVAAELAGASVLGADPVALQSHSPAFLNVTLQTRWTSTDVNDG